MFPILEQMSESPEHLDVRVGEGAPDGDASRSRRPWLGIHFECCNVYARVWRNKSATAYVGFCPQCARKIRLAIGSGGTDERFFSAW